MTLWDGRFEKPPAQEMVTFGSSLDVDARMWREDIEGSLAHLEVLRAAALITPKEHTTLTQGLRQVGEEMASGAFRPGPELEDIHMAVESRLTEIVGPVGGKLHTARSRNDQVATDVRLWLKRRMTGLHQDLVKLVDTMLATVRADGQILIPGFTHLQRGQPVLLGHHILAHAWAFHRDAGRVADALVRMDACPLGAGAMAGTPHPIDRHLAAEYLGFAGPVDNAMDAVAARDHAMEAAAACAILAVHLSRWAEELVVWSSTEFDLVRLGEGYATGSSIMPQKRNPDAAELVRGKTGRVVGDLVQLLTLVKGLPMAYNRDLQEDREALFDAVETAQACAQITTGMVATLEWNAERYETELSGDFLLATELADHLVMKGVTFREAHHAVGQLVGQLEAQGKDFSGIDLDVLRSHHPSFDEEALVGLNPRVAAERRTSFGGTSPGEIERQVERLSDWVRRQQETKGGQ
jgi:argininosuccinate lyase